jgi:hypothetical protein
MRQGLVDFSVAECVKHFDCGGNAVFSTDFLAAGRNFACKSGKINQPASIPLQNDGQAARR